MVHLGISPFQDADVGSSWRSRLHDTLKPVLNVFVLGTLLLLTACMMGPDYIRPETPQADSWRVTASTAESIANVPWWELLKDHELQKLVRLALTENLDLFIATANVEEFRAQLMISKFDLVPSIDYSGTVYGFRNTNNNTLAIGGGAVPAGNKDGGLSLGFEKAQVGVKWEVDLWGRIRRSIEATQAQLLSKEENQRAVILDLVSKVAEAYFDLRGLDLELDITKRNLKAWEESVRLSKLRYEQGDIPKLDLDRFVAERAGTASQRADLQRQIVQAENRLSILLGRKPMDIPRGFDLTAQPLPPEVPAGLPSELLQRRPDILKAEQELAEATANIGVAQATRFPQLALTGAVGGAGFQISGSSLGPFAVFEGAGSLTGPLLNASALGYQVQVMEARAKASMAKYNKTILTAFKEVEDSLIAVQKSGEQRVAQEQQVEALQSALRQADLRYQRGRGSYLDVLTAQRTLYESELALARVRRAQLTSVVQLYKALGGGWSPIQEQADDVPVRPGQERAEIQRESS